MAQHLLCGSHRSTDLTPMIRSLLPASGLAALGLVWFVSAAWRRTRQQSLLERLQRSVDDLQYEVYSS